MDKTCKYEKGVCKTKDNFLSIDQFISSFEAAAGVRSIHLEYSFVAGI